MTEQERADFIRDAMQILNVGTISPVERAVVEKAFDSVQKIKGGPKGKFGRNRRYNELTAEKRDLAKDAARHLKQALTILETWPALFRLAGMPLSISEHDLVSLDTLLRDLQIIGNKKLHGDKFDDRPLSAIPVVVRLLKAAGKCWSATRNGTTDKLAAILWGKPGKSFEEHLLRYKRLSARGDRAPAAKANRGTD
jgi:hypothetical protein